MKFKFHWTLLGALVGLFFPVLALLVDWLIIKERSVSFVACYSQNPVHFVHLFAPIMLSVIGFVMGSQRDKLHKIEKDHLKHIAAIEKEVHDLIDHIDDGICTIGTDYLIDKFYNRHIPAIFGEKEYRDTSIFDNIFYILEGDVKKELKEFIGMAFTNITASEEMLNSINPVHDFTYIYNDLGKVIHKRIKTTAVRIMSDDNTVSKLMFIFNDISLSEKLAAAEQKQEREIEEQYNMISAMLNNDRTVINQFVRGSQKKLSELKIKLQSAAQNPDDKEIIRGVLGLVHSLKGESFTLGFVNFTELLKEFEGFLKKTLEKTYDFEAQIQAIVFFEKMENEKKKFFKTIDKLKNFMKDVNATTDKDGNITDAERISLIRKELEGVCDKSAQSEGKEIQFSFKTDVNGLPETYYDAFKEIMLHLIRNSAAHGIEPPLERARFGKQQKGLISCEISRKDNLWILRYADDGAGFDLARIRNKAIEMGIHTAEQLDQMKENSIIALVFRSGFSTAKSPDDVSGVGVGMSVVKNIVMERLKGKILIGNNPTKGMTLRMEIPADNPTGKGA